MLFYSSRYLEVNNKCEKFVQIEILPSTVQYYVQKVYILAQMYNILVAKIQLFAIFGNMRLLDNSKLYVEVEFAFTPMC
jgi:hypothetical protein